MQDRSPKAVILAGGKGTRLSEETDLRPKPMVEIGGKPILWHIMKIYAAHGVTEFIICLGYKGYLIKEYFLNYYLHTADVVIDLQRQGVEVHRSDSEPWRIHLIETGEDTMTGGRLKRVAPYLEGEREFFMTYGDGVANINICALLNFHRQQGKSATITAVHSLARFGSLALKGDDVSSFREKPQEEAAWINGGFFVLSPKVFSLISGDGCVWEQEPLSRLAADGQLAAFRHAGFWQPMDTLREKQMLQSHWQSPQGAPWKVWK
jgi:glucose-1-phosphate cytidylyltransferase